MTTDIDINLDIPTTRPPDGQVTLADLVGELVLLAMSRDWSAEASGKGLLAAADGNPDLLARARVQLLKTTNPRSQVGRRALLTLAHAQAAASTSTAGSTAAPS